MWDLRLAEGNRFEQKVYLTQHIADDINHCGHNVVQTVFAQCGAMYKTDGPEELKCVGETEFVQVRPLTHSRRQHFTPSPEPARARPSFRRAWRR